MIKGVADQLRHDSLLKDGCYGIQVPDDEEQIAKEMRGPAQGYSGKHLDDLTGQVLKDSLVQEARAKELLYFHSKGVWVKRPKGMAREKTGRAAITVRWVDINKGDDMVPNYRSRLVARQLKAQDKSGQSFFAPAPPLEALRTVLSMAMTKVGTHVPDWSSSSPVRTQLSFVDVKRAYFNAKLDPKDPPVFVDLPAEDKDHVSMCAQLVRHMYGTRSAADGWQEEYSSTLVGLGFIQGDSCPNVFRHLAKDICLSVHGDDFTACGSKPALDWYETALAEHYELSVGPRLGPGPNDAKEARSLNRVIRWCDSPCRIEYEADPRQIERLISECGLDGSKSVATPGLKASFTELEEDSELPSKMHTAFRGAAARGNYLAADRIDSQFACKEICRWMSKPTDHSWQALKRICRYLRGVPRLVYTYPCQEVAGIDVYTDTDWAGCPKTRKSTSGGCVMLGKHTIKHWSSTQTSIALSSGEAEFAGVIRGAGQGLGYQALLSDFGVDAPLRVWTDSSAAIGICNRQGLGKLRHLDTHTLWIQQAVRLKRVDLRKVPGESNPADLLTKHSLSRDRLEMLVELFGCKFIDGRAESAPLQRKGASEKATMASTGQALNAVAAEAEPQPPILPHVTLAPAEMDKQYPPMNAPPHDELDDIMEDADDPVLQTGLRLAEDIRQCTRLQGRLRRSKEDANEKNEPNTENVVNICTE